jgi:pimeloyl-ACP methyl ester carboxylesterase
MARREDRFDVLAAWDRPVLVLAGEEDAVTSAADLEAMAEAAAGAPYVAFVTVPGAGHLAPLEKPDDVADALRALVDRCGC